MNGMELAARYSYMPNRLNYCGEHTFSDIFKQYLEGNISSETLENEMKKFFGHYLYLELIAKANNKNPFDPEVVEAFWVGNELLEKVKASDLKGLILTQFSKKIGKERAEQLASNLPKGIPPHHSFNPLYINFISSKVPKSIVLYDRCCVQWGKIKSVADSHVIVEYQPIIENNGKYEFGENKKIRVNTAIDNTRFIENPKQGDWISFHWLLGIEKLNETRLANLKKYTKLVMEKAKSGNF